MRVNLSPYEKDRIIPVEAFDGFVPIIIHVAPVSNISLFLGDKQEVEQEQLSQL
ncbi:MAG: hypothetical protein K8S27_01820 [Candidatus Omnitrophica bacterium]|nr:hypothetical protein [Candidatus Omnitrophota bacterium]